MEDTTQVVTAVNGVQFKTRELINEASYKPDGAVNGDPIKSEMNANGGSTESNISVDTASPPQKGSDGDGKPRGPTRAQKMNKLYSLPAPLRTFPLPTFVPHNPISLVEILYTWLRQTIRPPSSHPHALYQGVFSPELRSVHVTDERSIRALWQEGFFGKGSLSRSEPSWLDREKRRIGANASKTSEEVTRQRRAERQQAKWERARISREAIDQKLREEKEFRIISDIALEDDKSQSPMKTFLPPIGPEQLLRLPNSQYDLDLGNGQARPVAAKQESETVILIGQPKDQTTVPTIKNIPNGHASSMEYKIPPVTEVDQLFRPLHKPVDASISDEIETSRSINGDVLTEETPKEPVPLNRKKSVRFSPTIEQTTFLPSDPISSDFSKPSPTPSSENTEYTEANEAPVQIHNQEHIQLTMEEAFFLSYGLGVLSILDAHTHSPIPHQDILPLFRQTSYFPASVTPQSRPDDPFLLSYVVYHHFRSLGWCVRGGTKFGVDYLLYNRGPVFSHAEFAVLILPSYSHVYWSSDAAIAEDVRKKQSKKWNWLHCVNRVNGQVKKTLVLVYVDVPPPVEEEDMRVDEVLGRYKVREVVLKRWLSNRSRD